MTRPRLAFAGLTAVLLLTAGCGQDIEVPTEQSRLRSGAVLFNERCSGCHTFDAAAARGSKPEGQVSGGERTNGPNFNTRRETKEDVLFAIRNGGFSGAIMPANVVVGDEAQKVAEFVAAYAGRKRGTGDQSSDFGSGATGN